MKVATNSTLAKSKPHWVDWDAMANPDVEEFARKVLAVASGEPAANERNNARGIAIFKEGVTLPEEALRKEIDRFRLAQKR